MILYLSDFDMRGSGYMHIGVRLCNELAAHYGNDEILALGLNYGGAEHPWPFRIMPVQAVGHVPQILKLLRLAGNQINVLVVAMDLMFQEPFIDTVKREHPDMPLVSLFPVEAGPLCQPWAIRLHQADERLVMSEFGRLAMEDAGVPGHFIPIGVNDPDLWPVPTPDQRLEVRNGLGIEEDAFVVLTVADNQERKNLGRTAEILSKFSVDIEGRSKAGLALGMTEKRKMTWILVTRVNSPVGWKLDDIGMRCGILNRMLLYDRGVPHDKLWMLFAAADGMLLTSKAEGLGVPVMEAMACGLPVVGTEACAIEEHLQDGRGLLIEPEYQYIDPYGNGWRYFASLDDGVAQLERLADMSAEERQTMLDSAREYVLARNWATCGQIMIEAIEAARQDYQEEAQPDGHEPLLQPA